MTRRPDFGSPRVPIVNQLTAVDCGAACLAMVLGFLGRKASLAECRERCAVGRDGVSVRAIASAARAYDVTASAYSVLQLSDLGDLPTPAILHWRFNHFVILEVATSTGARIVDPASGRRWVSRVELDEAFTGVALVCGRDARFESPSTDQPNPVFRYFVELMRDRRAVTLLLRTGLASVCLQVMGLVVPGFMWVFVDRVVPYSLVDLMPWLAVGIVASIAAQSTIRFGRTMLLLYLQTRIDSETSTSFLTHLFSLPYDFFSQRTSGDLLMRLSSNAFIREVLTTQTLSVVIDGLLVAGYAAILCLVSPVFGLATLLVAAAQVGILALTLRPVRGLMERQLYAQAEAQTYVVEALTGIETLKASGSEPRVIRRWSDLYTEQLAVSLERGRLGAVVDLGLTALRGAASMGLLWVGVYRVLEGEISMGEMLGLNALAATFLAPVATLVGSAQQFQMVSAQLERLTDVRNAAPEEPPGVERITAPVLGRLDVSHLSFTYPGASASAIEDVSFSVERGQRVALVGPTGSGKSTLIKVLLGLYRPSSGSVAYDSVPIERLSLQCLRSRCGIVMQTVTVFSGSLRENISFDRPDAPLADVVRAAKLAGIHDDIERMPMRYETRVGERGVALSGGQRQRLALARALVDTPSMLFLDEATSSLDRSTERRVQCNLATLPCAQIIASHRLASLSDADVILVMDHGRVVESGTHASLLGRDGMYARLWHESDRDACVGHSSWDAATWAGVPVG